MIWPRSSIDVMKEYNLAIRKRDTEIKKPAGWREGWRGIAKDAEVFSFGRTRVT